MVGHDIDCFAENLCWRREHAGYPEIQLLARDPQASCEFILAADKLCGVLKGMKFAPRHALPTYHSRHLAY